jgi:hypothetical protein
MSRRPRGSATVETVLAAALVLLPLSFAVVEFALLAVARNALNHATFEAARAGSLTGVDSAAMRLALARGLVPLFAAGSGAVTDAAAVLRALGRAIAEVARPDLVQLQIQNPTAAAFEDFATDVDGVRAIPHHGLEYRNPWGPRSRQTLRDANVLAIRVRYCRQLYMPIISTLLPRWLTRLDASPADLVCYLQDRLPIEAYAVVQMQSPTPAGRLP